MSEHEDDDGALSFLDLLTCGLIGMMVLAIILSVAMATGGASSTITEELSPISQPASARPRKPDEIARDPLMGHARLYIVHDPVAALAGWTSSLPGASRLNGGRGTNRATHHVVQRRLQSSGAPLVSIGVSISPGPSDPNAKSSTDMVASWPDRATIHLDVQTSFEWTELNAAELERVRWDPVAEMIGRTSFDDHPDGEHLATLLRRGGIISAYDHALSELVPEACARRVLLAEYESALGSPNDARHIRTARLEALDQFFKAAAATPFDPDKVQPFPLVVLELQTNQAKSLRFWIGRPIASADPNRSQRLAIVFDKLQTKAEWN